MRCCASGIVVNDESKEHEHASGFKMGTFPGLFG